MPLYAFEGRSPKVDPVALIAPTAVLVGDVTVESGASVWLNANPQAYRDLAQRYLAGLGEVD